MGKGCFWRNSKDGPNKHGYDGLYPSLEVCSGTIGGET